MILLLAVAYSTIRAPYREPECNPAYEEIMTAACDSQRSQGFHLLA